MATVSYRCGIVLMLSIVVVIVGAHVTSAETPEEAIRRIQAGAHTPMPPPSTAPATGAAGKGMTIENGTGHTLHVHFSGPVSRTVVVADRTSESVELAVGDYQVAAEVPSARITPFFGRQAYQPFTHYWLKFYTKRVDMPPQTPTRAGAGPKSPPAIAAEQNPPLGVVRFCAPSYRPDGTSEPGRYNVHVLYKPGQMIRLPFGTLATSGRHVGIVSIQSEDPAFCLKLKDGTETAVSGTPQILYDEPR